MKKIFYDDFNLSLERGTGVATYARSLTFAAHELGYGVGILYGTQTPPSLIPLLREIALFDSNAGKPPRWLELINEYMRYASTPWGVRPYRVPISGTVITRQFASRLPYFDDAYNCPNVFKIARPYFRQTKKLLNVRFNQKPDIFHWTYPLPLRSVGSANLYTLHDLVPLRLPYTTLDNKRYHYRLLKKITSQADHICTVSEHSKIDIMNILAVPEQKITNTYQAINIPARYTEKTGDDVANEIHGVFGLNYKEYFLFYGAIEPKKNIGRMIEGFLAAKTDIPLVIVGAPSWKSEDELRLLNDERIRYFAHDSTKIVEKRIIHKFEYAPFPLLISLIRGARAVLFPSLYEGFGLPVLESMLSIGS